VLLFAEIKTVFVVASRRPLGGGNVVEEREAAGLGHIQNGRQECLPHIV